MGQEEALSRNPAGGTRWNSEPGTREEPGHAAGRGFCLSLALTQAQVTVGLKHATLRSPIHQQYVRVAHVCVCVCVCL